MTEHRWSKFWWQDYESDDALRVVSLAAQGMWMRMLCAMHKGTPYGHLTINGKQPSARQIALMVSATEREVTKLLAELEDAGVFGRIEDGTIYNRRMVRDKAIGDKASEDGKRGGNPALKPKAAGGLTPPDKPGGYTLDAEADTDTESKHPPDAPPKARAPRAASPTTPGRGCRIADDWTPDDPGFAGEHGVDGAAALPEFRDYWRAVAGKAGVKLDWEAVWRNQVRHLATKRAQGQPRKTSQMSGEDQDAELLRMVRNASRAEDENPQMLRLVQ